MMNPLKSVSVSFATLGLCLMLPWGNALASPPKDAQKVAEHFEFLGFKTEITKDYLLATKGDLLPIYVDDMEALGMNFNVAFDLNDQAVKERDKLINTLNSINARSRILKAYVREDKELVLEAVYTGQYNKQEFAAFVENYLGDYNLVYENADEITRYIKD